MAMIEFNKGGKILISMIMLTHNRKYFVEQMIEDVLNQSYTNFEYIIVNNGSADGTDLILSKYAQLDNRIKIVTLRQAASIGKGRNIGLRYANGEFVTYVDDDDRIEKNYLEFLYKLITDTDADIAMCGCDEFRGDVISPQCVFNERLELTGEEAVLLLLERKKIRAGMPTKLFRKDILLNYPFVEDCKSEDAHTAYKYFASAKKVIIHGLPNYHIRRHNENNSSFTSDFSKWTQDLLNEYLQLYKERTCYLIDKFPEHEAFFRYTELSFKLSMCDKIITNSLSDCERELDEMLWDLKNNKDELISSIYLKQDEKEKLKKIVTA
ncbi:hypothetical protein C819_03011 [Lachnospiraceae bacterium 10-1]|nr:hypothetical protein C819_03011 [Lachnospiraceae bacterium 10-1]